MPPALHPRPFRSSVHQISCSSRTFRAPGAAILPQGLRPSHSEHSFFSAMGDRSWQRPTFLRLSNQLSRWPDEELEPEQALTCQCEATRQAGGRERPRALSTSGLENARLWEKSEASRGLPARLFLGVQTPPPRLPGPGGSALPPALKPCPPSISNQGVC